MIGIHFDDNDSIIHYFGMSCYYMCLYTEAHIWQRQAFKADIGLHVHTCKPTDAQAKSENAAYVSLEQML